MPHKSHSPTSTTIRIAGMHCLSCDILIRTKLEEMNGITQVIPDHRSKTVQITHTQPLSLESINAVLCEYGYQAGSMQEVLIEESLTNKLKDAVLIALILGILYYFAKEARILPDTIVGTAASVGSAFVLGLIASASTCMATTGAVFATFIHKHHASPSRILLAGLFIAGRVVSYAVFGYVLGSFGQLLSVVTRFGTFLNMIIAVVMIIAGLDLLRIMPLSRLFDLVGFRPADRFPHWQNKHFMLAGAFLLGCATYFLPCGFTISTQAYAVGLGNALLSSQIMVAFALGTVPSLLLITLLGHIRNAPIYQYVLKAIGVVILVIGLTSLTSTFALYGLRLPQFESSESFKGEYAESKDGKQIVRMTATSSGYSPNRFIVRKDIPVLWEIDGKEIYGCQGTLQSPQAGIELTYLKEGVNTLEFIPRDVGIIHFSCSMGMFSGEFKVVEG